MNKKQNRPSAWQTWLRWSILISLAATALVLWHLDEKTEKTPAASPTPAPAVQRDERLRRETAYDRDVSALQALLDSGKADAATQEMAAQKLAALIAEHQHEIGLETALLEAGYEGAVVLVQNGAATVMIPESRMNDQTGAQILELCVIHAQVGAENVRVMGIR